ncbi:hypothetical protein LXL04_006409 [Taraxacum kok-saghyz]
MEAPPPITVETPSSNHPRADQTHRDSREKTSTNGTLEPKLRRTRRIRRKMNKTKTKDEEEDSLKKKDRKMQAEITTAQRQKIENPRAGWKTENNGGSHRDRRSKSGENNHLPPSTNSPLISANEIKCLPRTLQSCIFPVH